MQNRAGIPAALHPLVSGEGRTCFIMFHHVSQPAVPKGLHLILQSLRQAFLTAGGWLSLHSRSPHRPHPRAPGMGNPSKLIPPTFMRIPASHRLEIEKELVFRFIIIFVFKKKLISCQPKNIELIRNFETEKNQSNIFRMKKLKVFYKKSSIYSRFFETEKKTKIKNKSKIFRKK